MVTRLLAFVNATQANKKHPALVDYSAIVVDPDGNYIARHIGPSERDCRDTLQGFRLGSPWPEEYDRKFPDGWTFEWVDKPDGDPRLKEIEVRYRETRKLERPTGDDDPDDEGNPMELYDSLNQRVCRGPVSWEPLDGEFAKVRVLGPLEPEDSRELNVARRVWGDPIIASAKPSEPTAS